MKNEGSDGDSDGDGDCDNKASPGDRRVANGEEGRRRLKRLTVFVGGGASIAATAVQQQ